MTTTVGVSLKTYFSHTDALAWMTEVAELVRGVEAVASGAVRVFVAPTFLQIPAAVETFAGTGVAVAAQDVSAHPAGAFTGEVTAAELVEVGATIVEIGHAERRRLFGETDAEVAAKTSAALSAGLTPLICVGEIAREDTAAAVATVRGQLDAALDGAPAGPIIVAYEPVWAIGAPTPAPPAHIAAVTRSLRTALAARPDSAVVYGGSAGPGLLTDLGDAVDGLFLGRFAHDPARLAEVLREAGART